MKIFIDSADLDEIELAYSYGIIEGVTTNPSLIKKAVEERRSKGKDMDMTEYIKKILKIAKGTPVSLEVTENTYDGMVGQGLQLFRKFFPVANNVCVKIPVNPSLKKGDGLEFEGIRAIQALSSKRVSVNATLIFTPEQALLAAKAGARFVSPFAGRVDDYIRTKNKIKFKKSDYFPEDGICNKKGELLDDDGIISGIDLISEIVDIFKQYNAPVEVLAASLRNPRQVREAALAGAHAATIPFSVIDQLLAHHKTQEGMKRFTEDVIPEYADIIKLKK